MRRALWTMLIVAIVAAAVFAVHAAVREADARAAARVRMTTLETVAADAAEIAQLRAVLTQRRTGVRPDAGMVGQLSTALGKAGIPTSRLAEVAPEPEISLDAGAGGAELRRQAVRLTLQPVTLPEVGRFVQTWRSDRPEWTISGIELTRAGPAEVGIEPRLRCLVTLSAVYPAPAADAAGDVR